MIEAHSPKQVVVIGGGITGLAAAHRLTELDASLRVTLLEAGERLGGVLHTIHRDGFLIERSADNFITDTPAAVDLCRRIGMADELLPTQGERRAALVVHRGRLVTVPAGFSLLAPSRIWPLLTSPLLSPWGKLRLLAEYFVPPRRDDVDESLASFARRRLGREAYERIVQPLVGGIYTADPERLSLAATLPRFIDMERRHGGLIRAARRQRQKGQATEATGARYSLFVAPRNGLSSLVERLAARLPAGSVRLKTPVESIEHQVDGSWKVRLQGSNLEPGEDREIACSGVIVAVGADCAGPLLCKVDPELAALLARIPYAGTAIVSLVYPRAAISQKLEGFGFVVPAIEKRRILAGSFASLKFAGRAPQDMLLVRVFIGGACQSELLELDDRQLREIATTELAELLGTSAPPVLCDIARWPHSMPQYHVGHRALVAEVESLARRHEGLALAGNAYHGVGIPNCIASGERAAEHVAGINSRGCVAEPRQDAATQGLP